MENIQNNLYFWMNFKIKEQKQSKIKNTVCSYMENYNP